MMQHLLEKLAQKPQHLVQNRDIAVYTQKKSERNGQTHMVIFC